MSLAILHRVQRQLTEAGLARFSPTIAGGAVRDTILGRPIKDVDVWIPNSDVDTSSEVLDCLEEWYSPRPRRSDSASRSEWQAVLKNRPTYLNSERVISEREKYADVVGITDVISVPGFPRWEVICHSAPIDEIIAGFDYSICQAWLDAQGNIRTSAAFRKGQFDKRIFRVSPKQPNDSGDHEARLRAKFPEWKFCAWQPV